MSYVTLHVLTASTKQRFKTLCDLSHQHYSPVRLDWSIQTVGCPGGIVQELCESRGGRPGLSVLTSFLVSVDVKLYWTMLRHCLSLSLICQLTSKDIKQHYLPNTDNHNAWKYKNNQNDDCGYPWRKRKNSWWQTILILKPSSYSPLWSL